MELDSIIQKRYQCGESSFWNKSAEFNFLENKFVGVFLELNPGKYLPKLLRRLKEFEGKGTYFYRDGSDRRLIELLEKIPAKCLNEFFVVYENDLIEKEQKKNLDEIREKWPDIKIFNDIDVTNENRLGDSNYVIQEDNFKLIMDCNYGDFLMLNNTLTCEQKLYTEIEKLNGKVSYLFDENDSRDLLVKLKEIPQNLVKELFLAFENDTDIQYHIRTIKELRKKYPGIALRAEQHKGVLLGWCLGEAINPPRRITLEIFNDCNLKCDFCWTHSPLLGELHQEEWRKSWMKQKLSLETVKQYVDELDRYSVDLVELCAAGDPMFHPEAWEMVEYIKGKNLTLRISTNGTLITKKKAEFLINNGVEQLSMNISAGTRDSYAHVHNVDRKIFDSLEKNLAYLYEYSKKSGKIKPNIRIINVITSKNIRQIEEIFNFCQKIGADFIDFRHVWAHQNFQEVLFFNDEDREYMLVNKNLIYKKANEISIAHNLDEFYAEMEKETNQKIKTEKLAISKKETNQKNKKEISENLSFVQNPPCTISYHFNLLDVNNKIRYCCHGDQIHDDYEKVESQWFGDEYQNFRFHWKEAFKRNEPLCRGCPHIEENLAYWERIKKASLDCESFF